jgi:hypothetical protein
MWSNLYAYYNIKSDRNYSRFRLTNDIIQILEATGVLHKTSSLKFANKGSFPWIEIGIVQTVNGSFAVLDD